jgi:hypothetical protein
VSPFMTALIIFIINQLFELQRLTTSMIYS